MTNMTGVDTQNNLPCANRTPSWMPHLVTGKKKILTLLIERNQAKRRGTLSEEEGCNAHCALLGVEGSESIGLEANTDCTLGWMMKEVLQQHGAPSMYICTYIRSAEKSFRWRLAVWTNHNCLSRLEGGTSLVSTRFCNCPFHPECKTLRADHSMINTRYR